MAEEENGRKDDKKKKKAGRKAAGAAVAFTAAVGVFISSLFGSPNDLLIDPSAGKPAIVMDISTGDENEEEQESNEENEVKPGFFARIRMAIYKLPLFVRVAIGLPLWALGWLVTQAFSALWKLFLAPAAERILTFLIMAAVLLAVMTVLQKLIFPDLPLREILSKPNILIVLIGILAFCILNFVLDRADTGFSDHEGLIRFLEGLTILLAVTLRMFFRRTKRLKMQPA